LEKKKISFLVFEEEKDNKTVPQNGREKMRTTRCIGKKTCLTVGLVKRGKRGPVMLKKGRGGVKIG